MAVRGESVEALSAALLLDLRQLHEASGRPSIRKLEQLTGVSNSVISRALSGQRVPSRLALQAIAKALDPRATGWVKRWDAIVEAKRAAKTPPKPRPCAIDDCANPAVGKLCATHERHRRQYGDPLAGPFLITRHAPTCSRPTCDRPYSARGLCRMHYKRVRLASKANASPPQL